MLDHETTQSEITVDEIREAYQGAMVEAKEYIDDSPNDLCRHLAIAAMAYATSVMDTMDNLQAVEASELGKTEKAIFLHVGLTLIRYAEQKGVQMYNAWEEEFIRFEKEKAKSENDLESKS